MVLEAQVGFVMAVLGLAGCVLFLVDKRIRRVPAAWAGFFGGVLLYVVVHDLLDALLVEPFLRIVFRSSSIPGEVATLSLVALGILLGWLMVTTMVNRSRGTRGEWTPILMVTASLLALHAAVDGIAVGNALQLAAEEEVLAPTAIGLQVIHRALEGGIIVTAMLLAGVSKLRIFAVTFYVGLPMAVTTPWILYTTFDVMSSIGLVLAFALVGGFITFLALAAWPFISGRMEMRTAVKWVLVGFFVTLLAHNLAH